jgi:UDP-N-acetylglucosamine 4,6-dehydratase/5-epimerase
MNQFKNKVILLTGGTGSLGQALVKRLLPLNPKKIIIYSRDEYKQFIMKRDFHNSKNSDRLRYFIGDVRDITRLGQACSNVDYIIHTAALKQVDTLEYNPQEAIKTNILGALNVIQVAIENKVKKVVALSTDKAVHPVNLYGATKLCSDKLFINGNALGKTKFSVVRYGNVANSRGSVIPFFDNLIKQGEKVLPITDVRMTRFHITVDQGVDLIFTAFKEMQGGEIYIAKIPSYKIIDLVKSFKCNFRIIGIRPGEKLHEIMITQEDAPRTYDCGDYYTIQPDFDWIVGRKFKGKLVDKDFSYSSDKNKEWLFK